MELPFVTVDLQPMSPKWQPQFSGPNVPMLLAIGPPKTIRKKTAYQGLCDIFNTARSGCVAEALLEDELTLVVGHRGASAHAPENTIAAFELARRMGADWVELDVRMTADGCSAVAHDPHLADGRSVAASVRAELPEAVPTLARALAACSGMGVNIELKNEAGTPHWTNPPLLVQLLERELAESGWIGPALVSSFDLDTIDAVRAGLPELRTGFLIFGAGSVADLLGRTRDGGHAAINPSDQLVDKAFVDHAHRRELEVSVWTVDEPRRIGQLVDWGVDAVITNVVDIARSVVDRSRTVGSGDDEL